MTNLIVFDLDKTLLSIDSFSLLARENFNKSIFFIAGMRKLKLLNRHQCAKSLHRYLLPVLQNQTIIQDFAERLVRTHLNEKVRKRLKTELAAPGNETIIISASPHEYVSIVGENLGCRAFGSKFFEDKYLHLYGAKKVDFVKNEFPQNAFRYKYAVSDSESDLPLLRLFSDWDLIKEEL
jgi:HAD superfamily phosphoserine phosphatase-like hydrolase